MAKSTLYNITIDTPVQVTRELYTNVGSGNNIVGDYERAFLVGSDFEIWNSATGGTELTQGTDYEFDNYDLELSTEATEPIYSQYKILNPTYQTGNIYITYKTIGTYVDEAIISALTPPVVAYLDSTDNPYTIADFSGTLILICDTSGGNLNITLPTLADNQSSNLEVYHQVGGNDLNVDGEGAETIDGMTDIDMPKEGDRLKIIGTSSEWLIIDERISCQLRLDGHAGFGSTDTMIPRFTNSNENLGNIFSENHSTGYNSNTEGLEITANKSGKYAFTFICAVDDPITGYGGISLNSAQLTTIIQSITVADRICFSTNQNSWPFTLSVSLYLDSGDVIRPHTSGVTPAQPTWVAFIATYEGN